MPGLRAASAIVASVRGEALDGRDLASVGLDGKEPAGLHRHAVQEDGAGTAGRRVATDLGAGEAQDVAQVVDEEQARLNVGFDRLAVDPQRDVHGPWFPPQQTGYASGASASGLVAPQEKSRMAYVRPVPFVLQWTIVVRRRII